MLIQHHAKRRLLSMGAPLYAFDSKAVVFVQGAGGQIVVMHLEPQAAKAKRLETMALDGLDGSPADAFALLRDDDAPQKQGGIRILKPLQDHEASSIPALVLDDEVPAIAAV